ncbi:hypothetical protein ACFV9C_43300 [Kribbella sp. NPDC059898]
MPTSSPRYAVRGTRYAVRGPRGRRGQPAFGATLAGRLRGWVRDTAGPA